MVKTRTSRAGSSLGRTQVPTRSASAESGFTLIEVMVVVAILTVVITAAAQFAGPRSTNANLKAATQLVAVKLRNARSAAIMRRRQHRVFFDVASRRIWGDYGDGALKIDKRIRMSVTAAQGEKRTNAIASVRFYPNGSATGATLQLLTESQTNEVRINWLTGRVSTKRIR